MNELEKVFSEEKKKIFILGIMGGIASGKSTVGHMFELFGAKRLDADLLAHAILEEEKVKKKVVEAWGESLLQDGKINRKALATIVFPKELENKEQNHALRRLEEMIHPVLRLKIHAQIQKLIQEGQKVIVFDMALLWESGLKNLCDVLIFVDTPLALRQERAAQNRNWALSEILLREKFQADLEVKKKAAHFIIPNNGNLSEVAEKVQNVWQTIIQQNPFFKELGACYAVKK